MYSTIDEAIKAVAEFAEQSREKYAATKEWTSTKSDSCETIRVPVALLNRIREMRKLQDA